MEALAEPGKAYLTENTAELAARLPRARRPRRVRDQGRQPAGAGLRAGRRRRGPLAPRPLPRARLLPLRRPRRGDGRASRRRSSAAERGEGAAVGDRRRTRASARAGSATSSPSAAASEGVEVFEAQAQAHGRSIPFMPVLQMLRSYFGIGDGDTGADRAREDRRPRAAARPRASPTTCRCSSTSSASPTPTARCRR